MGKVIVKCGFYEMGSGRPKVDHMLAASDVVNDSGAKHFEKYGKIRREVRSVGKDMHDVFVVVGLSPGINGYDVVMDAYSRKFQSASVV